MQHRPATHRIILLATCNCSHSAVLPIACPHSRVSAVVDDERPPCTLTLPLLQLPLPSLQQLRHGARRLFVSAEPRRRPGGRAAGAPMREPRQCGPTRRCDRQPAHLSSMRSLRCTLTACARNTASCCGYDMRVGSWRANCRVRMDESVHGNGALRCAIKVPVRHWASALLHCYSCTCGCMGAQAQQMSNSSSSAAVEAAAAGAGAGAAAAGTADSGACAANIFSSSSSAAPAAPIAPAALASAASVGAAGVFRTSSSAAAEPVSPADGALAAAAARRLSAVPASFSRLANRTVCVVGQV